MIEGKGLFEQIRQVNTKVVDSAPPPAELKKAMEKIFAPREETPRIMWLGDQAVELFHRALGDKGFMSMLESCDEITVGTGGAEYIEQFVKRMERMWRK